ncbi:hypothetical protein NQZ68_023788 [Dissostichus eleginoides]|nr:hypothetical protein NQZ68_023788 [Dissostichus eleginoides]
MGKKAKELWNNDFTCVFSKYRLEDLVKLGCARLFIVACLFIVMQKAEESPALARTHTHTHKHVEYNPGPIDANAGLPRASLVFTAVAFASLSVAVVMLPTQVMINGAFSFSASHRAEQGAEEVLARTQIQPRLARPLPRRKTTQTPGGCKALGAGAWWDTKKNPTSKGAETITGGVQKARPCAAAVWARLNSLSQGAGAIKR